MHSFVDAMHMQDSGLVFIMGSQKAGLGLPIMLFHYADAGFLLPCHLKLSRDDVQFCQLR